MHMIQKSTPELFMGIVSISHLIYNFNFMCRQTLLFVCYTNTLERAPWWVGIVHMKRVIRTHTHPQKTSNKHLTYLYILKICAHFTMLLPYAPRYSYQCSLQLPCGFDTNAYCNIRLKRKWTVYHETGECWRKCKHSFWSIRVVPFRNVVSSLGYWCI